jgi:type IV pilus assembly protein PilP
MPRRPIKAKARNSSLLLACFFVFIPFFGARASQDVVYKPARPLKTAPGAMKGTAATGMKEAGPPSAAFIYDPTGKTDPFKSFIAEPEEVKETERRRPKTYLETVDLSQLELIAIIVGPRGNWAMVRDSKGTGHVLKKGVYVGTNGGFVHRITEKEVVVREEYRDFKGNKKDKDIPKRLPSLE